MNLLQLLSSSYACLVNFEGGLRPLFLLTAKVVLLCELVSASLVILCLSSNFRRWPAATFFVTAKVVLLCELASASLVILCLSNIFWRWPAATFFLTAKVILFCELVPAFLVMIYLLNLFWKRCLFIHISIDSSILLPFYLSLFISWFTCWSSHLSIFWEANNNT